MSALRKILIFLAITAGLILLGKLAGRLIPIRPEAPPMIRTLAPDTNTVKTAKRDTSGGRWRETLFRPLLEACQLPEKSLRRKQGNWEIVFPKGKPIHEYALLIEKICAQRGITVVQGVELRPKDQRVEYHLADQGQVIKIRASLGTAFIAGSARLAIVLTGLDSLKEPALAALRADPWEKTLVVNPYSPNAVLKTLRASDSLNEILLDLPMEPSSYPYVDPGKHALFIHHVWKDVANILTEALDSFPDARGFASRYGDRAIENQPLLEKLFRFTSGRDLVFLDLTASPRSLSRQVAASVDAHCRSASIFKDGRGVEEELARKAVLAGKTGEAVLTLAYSALGYQNLKKALAADEIRFSQMGLELVTLSSLASRDSGAAAPTGLARK